MDLELVRLAGHRCPIHSHSALTKELKEYSKSCTAPDVRRYRTQGPSYIVETVGRNDVTKQRRPAPSVQAKGLNSCDLGQSRAGAGVLGS